MGANIIANNETLEFIKKYDFVCKKEDSNFTSIIILTHNQLSYTKLCIESIRKFTHKDNYEIIIIDNNSTDDTRDWLKKQKDLNVIYNNENKGFPAGCNQGIKVAKGDNILLLNNDTIVTPNWLNNLLKALYSDEKVGIVGAISNCVSNLQQIDTTYTNIEDMLSFASKINISNENMWDQRGKLIGFCYLIKKEVLDKIGLLDERFTPGNFEDDDFSLRAVCNDYKLLLCKDAFIHHFGSVSFNQDQNEFLGVFERNLKKFNDKWKFNTQYSSCIRLEVINLFNSPLDAKINVLEVGCSLGLTLLEVKNKYRNAEIHGIEIDENVAKITKHLVDTIVGNIENMDLPYKENYFDYIIFADVLEHLVDPWEILRKIKKYLKSDGYIIASIPNLMYIGDLANLIRGNFTYTSAGILDKTHLRFFTLNEIQKLFDSAELKLDFINAVAQYTTPEQDNIINTLCQISSEDIRQQYSVYQYLVRASIKPELSRYDEEHMLQFKFKLMRLDNDLDVDNSLDYILQMYLNDNEHFESDLKYLLEIAVIDKEKVVNLIAKAALEKKIIDLYNILK